LVLLEEKLEAAFANFQQACESFKALLSEYDIDESWAYFNEVKSRFTCTSQRLHEIAKSEVHNIQPGDSVSQESVCRASKVSKNSNFSNVSSIKSAIGKKMLRNATRKAAFIVKDSCWPENKILSTSK